MAYNFAEIKTKIETTKEWLVKEMGGLRTGRATPAILDNVFVDSYGSRIPLKQAAAINIEDPRTLRVAPYDSNEIKSLEKAVLASNLGLSVASDERGLRISFPELTSERRSAIIKVAKEKLEQAKIALRKIRDEAQKDIEGKEKAKNISEDEKFRAKADLQKLIDLANAELDKQLEKKEKEISA